MHPAKTQISLGIRPVWSVFAVSMKKAWTLSYPLNAQPRLMRLGGCPGWSVPSLDPSSLIWVFAGRTATLLVLSRGGSNVNTLCNIHIIYRCSCCHRINWCRQSSLPTVTVPDGDGPRLCRYSPGVSVLPPYCWETASQQVSHNFSPVCSCPQWRRSEAVPL